MAHLDPSPKMKKNMKELLTLLFSLLSVCAFVGIPAVFFGFLFGIGFGLGFGVFNG